MIPRALRRPPLLGGALLLTLTTGLLALRLLWPPALRVDVGAPGDAYLATSFYQPEQAGPLSFRWSGPHSALRLPELVADSLILRVRLAGSAPGQRLTLGPASGAGGATLETSPGWRAYHVLLAAPHRPGGAPREIALDAALTEPAPGDPRELGVAVDWVRLEPLPPAGRPARLLGLNQAALLGWALALVAGAVWLAAAPLTAPRRAAWLAVALTAPAAAALLIWAWADPYGLSWLIPLRAGALAAATVALGGAWAVGDGRWTTGAGRQPSAQSLPGALLWPGALLGLSHLALLAPLPAAWRGAAALIILWAPGWLLARWALADEPDRLARLALGLCGALGLQVLILMASSALPGGLTGWRLVLLCDALALIGLALMRGGKARGSDERPASTGGGAAGSGALGSLALIMLLAAALRLIALGGAELHDDEASVLIAASQLVGGQADVLLTQLKGPAQILLPAGPLALSGQLSEHTARLPFAAAGLGVVLMGFVVARRITGGATPGLAAALILALDGLQIAFSRIVQYQTLVSLLALAGFWGCWRFYEGAAARRYLTIAALGVAVALLGHYDAIYVLAPLVWLVLAGARRRGWGLAQTGRAVAWPGVIGGAMLASFYGPFGLHPHFSETIKHLGERTGQQGGGGALYNNLAVTYSLVTFYNHPAQVWLVGGLALGGVALWLVRLVRPRPVALGALALLAWGAADLLRGPDSAWLLGAGGPALALSALVLGLLSLAPGAPPGVRVTALWLGLTWGSMLFLIAQPRTHVYVVGLPAALLAAQALSSLPLPDAARRRQLVMGSRAVLAGGVLLAVLAACLHQYTLFVRQSPEYQRVYPAARLAALGGPATNPLDPAARFGFPSRDGWKAAGELYRQGVIAGSLASNQSSEVIAWYLDGYRRCGREPDFYLIALAAANPAIPTGYHRFATIQASGGDQLAIFSRERPAGAPQRLALEDYTVPFDERPIGLIPPPQVFCEQLRAAR